jgi:hypothetical protein|tara:strand:- start:370 stop:1386 length:1017 start_codon:yes stop_codon:yes gene_type:complete
MAFLQLNGVTINVGEGASNTIRITGPSETNIGGGHYQDTRYRKRTWAFTTTPYTEMEALAYAGLIRGEGQLFTMDDTLDSTKNVSPAVSPVALGSSYETDVPTGFSGKSRINAPTTAWSIGTGIIKPQQDLTYNLWTKPPSADPVSLIDYLITFYDTSVWKNSFKVYREQTDGSLNFKISAYNSTGASDKQSQITVADPFDGNWKMLTFVLRRNAESDEYNQYMYVNGVLQAYTATAHIPTPSNWSNLTLGMYSGGSSGTTWEHKIDDLQLLPFAAPASMVLGWYTFGQEMGALPNLKMTGDITNDSLVTVRGEVESVSHTFAGGRTRQQISFTLTEV